MNLSVKFEIEGKRPIVGEFVNLSQHVQVWKVHLQHRSEGEKEGRDV